MKTKMKRYPRHLVANPNDEVQFKIVCPTEKDRQELRRALRHIHDAEGVDHRFIAVNQLAHMYELDQGITAEFFVVNKKAYHELKPA